MGSDSLLKLPGHPVTQEFENETVGCDLAALGVVSLANMAVMGWGMLGRVGIVCHEVHEGGMRPCFEAHHV